MKISSRTLELVTLVESKHQHVELVLWKFTKVWQKNLEWSQLKTFLLYFSGGTATGGGTFWGLGRLLTKAKGFDELLEMATHGDFRKVDMLVKDIYGDRDADDYTATLGLSPTVIASSFGKAIHHDVKNE